MNSVDKNNLLEQAICCAGNKGKEVADMFLTGNKCAESEFKDLALLVFAINALDCYNAPLETTTYEVIEGNAVDAEFQMVIPCSILNSVLDSDDYITLTINGETSTTNGNDISTFGELFFPLLDTAGFTYNVTSSLGCADGDAIIDITANCNTTEIIAAITIVAIVPSSISTTSYTGINTVVGNCEEDVLESSTAITEYENCFTEDEADNIANIITSKCDICDCDNN